MNTVKIHALVPTEQGIKAILEEVPNKPRYRTYCDELGLLVSNQNEAKDHLTRLGYWSLVEGRIYPVQVEGVVEEKWKCKHGVGLKKQLEGKIFDPSVEMRTQDSWGYGTEEPQYKFPFKATFTWIDSSKIEVVQTIRILTAEDKKESARGMILSILDNTPVETKIKIHIEMAMIDLLSKMGYREGSWTEEEDVKLSILMQSAKELTDCIIKEYNNTSK